LAAIIAPQRNLVVDRQVSANGGKRDIEVQANSLGRRRKLSADRTGIRHRGVRLVLLRPPMPEDFAGNAVSDHGFAAGEYIFQCLLCALHAFQRAMRVGSRCFLVGPCDESLTLLHQ
jgi:hypothetical protein